MRAGTESRPGFGFTLVELLIVIAVISLLVALLIPALGKIMGASSTAQCKENQVGLLLAVQTYALEHDNLLPWNNWSTKDAQWETTTASSGWLYYYPVDATPEEVETGSLWPYVRFRSTYRCPRHDPPHVGSEKFTSYTMNGAVSRYGDMTQMVPYRIDQLPTDAICFWEPKSSTDGGTWDDGSSSPDEGATGRHDDGSIVISFGGYVDWLSDAEYQEEEAKDPGRLWCAPTADGH